ncbi:NUDIX domain-containing protein [bacterium]|nr:MAG: NUDIX domain-containing protein [bacterium]|tara:strand:- start:8807 stop:9340 length:534 start_codon:yes stop_codon:yes gene_type:complete
MSLLRELIKKYCVRYPNERKAQAIQSFLVMDKNPFSRSNPHGHFTGSAWIVNPDKSKTLMTHHKKIGKWLQLGGHADGEEDLMNVSLREAKEESGLSNFAIVSEEIFDMDIHEVPSIGSEPKHLHYDIRFILEANPDTESVSISDESYDVAWIELDRVHQLNAEESIMRMVNKTRML